MILVTFSSVEVQPGSRGVTEGSLNTPGTPKNSTKRQKTRLKPRYFGNFSLFSLKFGQNTPDFFTFMLLCDATGFMILVTFSSVEVQSCSVENQFLPASSGFVRFG